MNSISTIFTPVSSFSIFKELDEGSKKPVNEQSNKKNTVADIKEQNQTPSQMSLKSRQIVKSTPLSNLRRGKRSLMEAEELGSKTKEDNNNNGTEMLEMLKSQRELLQSFQEEIQSLRAEVRSQAASECDIGVRPIETPSKKGGRCVFPTRRLYPNLCPGTAPSKRKRIESSDAMQCWTPQSARNRTKLPKNQHSPETPVTVTETQQRIDQDLTEDEEYDDERPALNQTWTNHDALNMKQQSLFEKVKQWQKKNLDTSPVVDKDGFAVPRLAPMLKKSLTGKSSSIVSSSSYFRTPDVTNLHQQQLQRLQFAPKKKEATKKRCLTSSDEGFYDQMEVDSVDYPSGPGIRRTLFDKLKCDEAASVVCQDEQKAPVAVRSNEKSDVCQGCVPSVLLDSTSCIRMMERSLNTCNYHYEFIRSLKKAYSTFNQLQPQQQHHLASRQFLAPITTTKTVPNRGLLGKNKEWESMSVFSYRSETSIKSHATERTVSTYHTLSYSLFRFHKKKVVKIFFFCLKLFVSHNSFDL